MVNASYAELSIIQTFIVLSREKKSKYCFPSQEKILDLLKRFYGVEISRRTLNRKLGQLEDAGYIRRIRRISRGDDGRPRFASTIYVLAKKTYKLVYSIFRTFSDHIKTFVNSRRSRERSRGSDTEGRVLSAQEVIKLCRQARQALDERG